MQITDILAQMGGLKSIARELGVSESQAADGAQALVPAILGGFKKQAQAQPTGGAGLGSLPGQLGGGGLLDNVLAPQATDVSRGNDVLGQIFGSKDVSRAVAQSAATQSGLDTGLLKKMLPLLAMLVAGYMARQQGAGTAAEPGQASGLGGLLGSLLGGKAGDADREEHGGREPAGAGDRQQGCRSPAGSPSGENAAALRSGDRGSDDVPLSAADRRPSRAAVSEAEAVCARIEGRRHR